MYLCIVKDIKKILLLLSEYLNINKKKKNNKNKKIKFFVYLK